jgi:hypothetical protein
MSNDTNAEGTIEMLNTETDKTDNDLAVEQWLQVRKDAALLIDAETAEVSCIHGYVADPYGVFNDLSWEEQVIGRNDFAREPGSDIWVSFRDLPNETLEKLWKGLKDGDISYLF